MSDENLKTAPEPTPSAEEIRKVLFTTTPPTEGLKKNVVALFKKPNVPHVCESLGITPTNPIVNPEILTEIYEQAICENEAAVINYIATNPNIPYELFHQVISKYLSERGNTPSPYSTKMLRSILDNPKLEEGEFFKIVKNFFPNLQPPLLAHPLMTETVLRWVVDRNEVLSQNLDRAWLFKSAKALTTEMIDELVDKEWEIGTEPARFNIWWGAAAHDNASESTVRLALKIVTEDEVEDSGAKRTLMRKLIQVNPAYAEYPKEWLEMLY